MRQKQEEREAGYFDEVEEDGGDQRADITEPTSARDPAAGEEDGGLTIKARSLRRSSSWNDSISTGSSVRRKVPPRNSTKN